MKLIEVPCYNCHSEKFSDYDSENGYKLVKCNSCGLLLVNPRPAEEDISKAKVRGVHEGKNTIETTGRYMIRKKKRFIKILKDFYPNQELQKKDSSWLDIGCGYGELIEALGHVSNNKVKSTGTELNEIKVASAKKRGLNVDLTDLNDIHEKFDSLSLFNVWSHLPDPVQFISGLKRFLKPGGEILIETGHTSHLEPKHQLVPYYLPDHLSFANKDIVENVLQNVGFEIVKTKIYRSTIYPRLYHPLEIGIEFAKIILRKYGSIKNFFPKHPNRDMFIRARLKG